MTYTNTDKRAPEGRDTRDTRNAGGGDFRRAEGGRGEGSRDNRNNDRDSFGGDDMGFEGEGDFGGGYDVDKDRKMFAKRKSCWFSAKKIVPDWKDPSTYSWLVNEFGKISPARVTGITPKFHRQAVAAIKRARAMGLISYTSSHIAR